MNRPCPKSKKGNNYGGVAAARPRPTATSTVTASTSSGSCPPGGYWVSCRFCHTSHRATQSGIDRIVDHEFAQHPKEFSRQNKRSNFYKIFKVKDLMVDARPTHPLLKTIMKLNQFMAKSKSKTASTSAGSSTNRQATQPAVITIDSDDESDDNPSNTGPPNGASTSLRRSSSSEGPPPIPSPVPMLSSYTARPNGASSEDRTCKYCHRVFKWPSVLRIHLKSCVVYSCLLAGGGATPPQPSQTANTSTSTAAAAPTPRLEPPRISLTPPPQSSSSSNREEVTNKEPQPQTDSSAHTCSVCSKYFIDPGNLRKHMTLHAGRGAQRGLSCKFCIKQFRNAILLDQHVSSSHDKERPYNCIHCTAKYKTQVECNDHVRQTHSTIPQVVTDKTSAAPILVVGPSSLTCELCSTVCLNKMELISHRAIVHRISAQPFSSNMTSDNVAQLVGREGDVELDMEQDGDQPTADEATEDTPEGSTRSAKYKCHHCRLRFPRWNEAVKHAGQFHRGSAAEGFPCRFCRRTLNTRAGNRHHETIVHAKQKKRFAAEEMNDMRAQAGASGLEGSTTNTNSNEVEARQATQKISKCRFGCGLWFSDRTKRTIHERRQHTDELATIMLKEKEVLERENPATPTQPGSSEAAAAAVPTSVITTAMPPSPHPHRRTSKDDNDRILAEEVQVEMKPEFLSEYMDESAATPAPAMSMGQSASVGSPPAMGVQDPGSLDHVLSPAVRIPLRTSALNNPDVVQDEPDPLASTAEEGGEGSASTLGFYCQFCQQHFPVFLDLTVHLDTHNYCTICEQKFISPQRYRQHLLSEHDRIRKIFCQVCCAAFIDLWAYSQHSLQVHGISAPVAVTSAAATSASTATGSATTWRPPVQGQISSTSTSTAPRSTLPVAYEFTNYSNQNPPPGTSYPTTSSSATTRTGAFKCSACGQICPTLQALQVHHVNSHTEAQLTTVPTSGARQGAPAQAQVVPVVGQWPPQQQQQMQIQQQPGQQVQRRPPPAYPFNQAQLQQQLRIARQQLAERQARAAAIGRSQVNQIGQANAPPTTTVTHNRPQQQQQAPPPAGYSSWAQYWNEKGYRLAQAGQQAQVQAATGQTAVRNAGGVVIGYSQAPQGQGQGQSQGQGQLQPQARPPAGAICDLCGWQAPNQSILLQHKVHRHGYSATESINDMIGHQVRAELSSSSSSALVPLNGGYVYQNQNQQTQMHGQYNHHQQVQPQPFQHVQQQQQQPHVLQQVPGSGGALGGGESIEITQVRVVTQSQPQNPNQNPNQAIASYGNGNGGGDCVIVEEHIHQRQQPHYPHQQSTSQAAVPSAGGQQQQTQTVVQHLQRFVQNRQLPLAGGPSQWAMTGQHSGALPPALPSSSTTSTPQAAPTPGFWCAYCQNGFYSQQTLAQHCLVVHGIQS